MYNGKPPEAALVATEGGYEASYDQDGYYWAVLSALPAIGFPAWFVYLLVTEPEPVSIKAVSLAVGLLAPLVGLAAFTCEKYTSSVVMTSTGITAKSVFHRNTMKWTDVARVDFASRTFRIQLHGSSGQLMQLPGLEGCEADLERCVRKYLPDLQF